MHIVEAAPCLLAFDIIEEVAIELISAHEPARLHRQQSTAARLRVGGRSGQGHVGIQLRRRRSKKLNAGHLGMMVSTCFIAQTVGGL